MQYLHVKIGSKSLPTIVPFKITCLIGRLGVAKSSAAYFPWRQKRVVIFEPQNTVAVSFAKIVEGRDGVTVKMIVELKLRIELHHKPEGRWNIFVNFGHHQTRPEV